MPPGESFAIVQAFEAIATIAMVVPVYWLLSKRL